LPEGRLARFIAGGWQPDRDTMAAFRKRGDELPEELARRFRKIAPWVSTLGYRNENLRSSALWS